MSEARGAYNSRKYKVRCSFGTLSLTNADAPCKVASVWKPCRKLESCGVMQGTNPKVALLEGTPEVNH